MYVLHALNHKVKKKQVSKSGKKQHLSICASIELYNSVTKQRAKFLIYLECIPEDML